MMVVVMVMMMVVMIVAKILGMMVASEFKSVEHILQSDAQSLHAVYSVLISCPYPATLMAVNQIPVVADYGT
jgi:uncharacterized BrkB/YihY/UPF0761 family membrane protein